MSYSTFKITSKRRDYASSMKNKDISVHIVLSPLNTKEQANALCNMIYQSGQTHVINFKVVDANKDAKAAEACDFKFKDVLENEL